MLIQLKENQGNLYKEISNGAFMEDPIDSYETVEKNRNRLELRITKIYDLTKYLKLSSDWKPYISCVVQVCRKTERFNTKNKTWKLEQETSYYLANFKSDAVRNAAWFGANIRNHWGVENSNHHVRDVILEEDASRIRKNPGIFARIRSIALNILNFNKYDSIAGAREMLGWGFDEEVLKLKGIF